MEKLPLASVATAVLLPNMATVAPIKGIAFSSVTFPVTVDCCAKRALFNKNIAISNTTNFLRIGMMRFRHFTGNIAGDSSIRFKNMVIYF
jgi:hypothetical protein